MNTHIQQKLKQFQEIAKQENISSKASSGNGGHHDALTKAIRTKEDAALFIAELKAAIEQSR